jgi:hypothetical protein
MVLNVIPNFAPMVDYTLMKNSVIPRIKTLCLQTSSLAVSNVLLALHVSEDSVFNSTGRLKV